MTYPHTSLIDPFFPLEIEASSSVGLWHFRPYPSGSQNPKKPASREDRQPLYRLNRCLTESEMAVRHSAVAKLPNLIRSLRKDSPKPLNHALPSLRRTFSLYDQINLIDNVPEDQLRFQGYNDTGFTVNKVEYEGSLLCVGNLLLSWKPKKFSEITSDSLSVFQILRPIPEILIIGSGRHIQQVDPELRRFIRSTGMKLEAVDSRNAASTYNILNEEGRIVAAALLPYGVTS